MTRPADLEAFRPQRGATLIIAMILLLVMSLLAAASLRGTLMQERMSSNTYDRDLAFQSAEAGLRMGEQRAKDWVTGGAVPTELSACTAANTSGPYKIYRNTDPSQCTTPLWEGKKPGVTGSFWHDAHDDTGNIKFADSGLSLAPYYIVELITENAPCDPAQPDKNTVCKRFRVTASSRPTDGRSQVTLQSIYAIQ